MALMITEECINCGACQPECPNTAIYVGGEEYELNGQMFPALSADYYYVVPEKCTECVGFHDDPQCVAVCPTDACQKNPAVVEAHDKLLEKAKALHPDKTIQ
jgi:ferredoxin